jgi:hypothetical protein
MGMKFGTYNDRSLKIESKELTEYEVDVVGVQEVRLDKGA